MLNNPVSDRGSKIQDSTVRFIFPGMGGHKKHLKSRYSTSHCRMQKY